MKQLKSFVPKHCENCGHRHNELDFSFVGQKDGVFAFQLSCNRCGSLQLLRTQPGIPGISLQKMVNNTDVKGAEFSKFAGKPQVHQDEALQVYLNMESVETIDDFLDMLESSSSD